MRKSKVSLNIVAAVVLALTVTGVGEARTKKGDKLLKEGRVAEQKKDWDKALDLYEKALSEDPSDTGYEICVRRVRFQAAQAHVNAGQKLRHEGKVTEALSEFEKAYAMDPSSAIAEQELRRTLEMIDRNNRSQAKPEDRGLTAAEVAHKEELERISRIQGPPELRPLSSQRINLRMTNQPPRVLYETVGKLAGINVVFDADYRQDMNASKPLSIELNNSTLEDALDYLATMTKTFWKPLSPNTIFVTTDNQQKRREYQDYAVKVFYLQNATTPQELTEITTTLRTVAEIRKLFQVTSLNAIIVKGTPDEIALAEKLVNDLDKPRAEVVVDVVVMEANRAKTRDLAATIASGGQAGLKVPILFTPRNPVLLGGSDSSNNNDGSSDNNGTSNNGSIGSLLGGLTAATQTQQLISLARIAKLSTNDFSITLPDMLLNFMMTDRTTKVLQSPQVRAASGQKASLRIGDKVPVAQGGFQPFGGTAGGFNSLYSQFQFIDVGVNVDITPIVHGDNEVTLKVAFEISNVRDRVDIGGISQPVIGQRRVEHEIRIKEGEASLLGGLMQEQDSKSVSGVPGLASIPVVKWLFSSESTEKNQSELLIALIPHIVRTPGISDVNLRSVAAGAESIVRVNRAPRPEAPAEPAAQPAKPPAAAPAVPVPVAPLPGIPGVTVPAPGQTPTAPPAPAVTFLLRPPATPVQRGSTFTVELYAQNARDLFAAPFHLKFNPQIIRLQDVKAGPLLSADGRNIVFTRNILNDTGDLTVNLNRMPDTGGVSGSGVLAVFTFQAVAPGEARIGFSQFSPRDSKLADIKAEAPQTVVTVR